MPKIIKVKACFDCPYMDSEPYCMDETPELKCMLAPSDNYGRVIEDIFEIPAWCELEDAVTDTGNPTCTHGHVKTECALDCEAGCPYNIKEM